MSSNWLEMEIINWLQVWFAQLRFEP